MEGCSQAPFFCGVIRLRDLSVVESDFYCYGGDMLRMSFALLRVLPMYLKYMHICYLVS